MIAAVAITHGLELVTGNTSHYQRLRPLATRSRWSIGGFDFPARASGREEARAQALRLMADRQANRSLLASAARSTSERTTGGERRVRGRGD
jgi:hypothetical protein